METHQNLNNVFGLKSISDSDCHFGRLNRCLCVGVISAFGRNWTIHDIWTSQKPYSVTTTKIHAIGWAPNPLFNSKYVLNSFCTINKYVAIRNTYFIPNLWQKLICVWTTPCDTLSTFSDCVRTNTNYQNTWEGTHMWDQQNVLW